MADFKKKLHDEIMALEYELRNELPKEILKARAHGDLSENAEYHAAKERQEFVNARGFCEAIHLKNAVVLDECRDIGLRHRRPDEI